MSTTTTTETSEAQQQSTDEQQAAHEAAASTTAAALYRAAQASEVCHYGHEACSGPAGEGLECAGCAIEAANPSLTALRLVQ